MAEPIILHGNNIDLLRELPDNSIDSIVTDPPYELGFMGKKWDNTGIAYSVELWAECLRVLKHGGHLLAFSHARTYHRMVVAIEDAGFDIRDQIMWVYGSGFPKSLNISKAMTKQTGESVDKAQQWAGWGTALKPAHEPIVMARKPIKGTVANNVLMHGTGGINIDGTRVAYPEGEVDFNKVQRQQATGEEGVISNAFGASALVGTEIKTYKENGRFPANFIHDGSDEVLQLFPDVKSGSGNKNTGNRAGLFGNLGAGNGNGIGGDSGSASRFFYCAKANKAERNAGLQRLPKEQAAKMDGGAFLSSPGNDATKRTAQNFHPTVKPIALMRYLVRLVTPPNGRVLDPFAGSGTTLVACVLEGFESVGMEMTADYLPIINGRIEWAIKQHLSAEQLELDLWKDE
jgi:site-specific DNA-methyltransferase (adenine-specific)